MKRESIQFPFVQPSAQTLGKLGISDHVETRIGKLSFFDGLPDAETVNKLYDHLDFMRGVEVFLNLMGGAAMFAMRQGISGAGAMGDTIGIWEDLMDPKTLMGTANTDTVYAAADLDLSGGPVVFECPPDVLGFVNDAWDRYICDMGRAGPDQGKGGKYLFLPPDYQGEVPQGYFVFRSSTYGNILAIRGFLINGDPKPAVQNMKRHARLYPLKEAAHPPAQQFINFSGIPLNTIFAGDFTFYEQLNQIVQDEPADSLDPELGGQLAAIGIVKGKDFTPNARMKAILTEAAAVGNGTSRLVFANRDKEAYYYPGGHWKRVWTGGTHDFLKDGYRQLDSRALAFFYGVGVSPAMMVKRVGVGSQYAIADRDFAGNYFDGGKSYKLRLPDAVPAKDFWSVIVYDTQTRSMLQNDQPFPSINSYRKGLAHNDDGSTDIYFGPQAPAGKENNWIRTVPGKSWYTALRLYGPLEPWFDQSWRPGEIEALK